MAQDAARIGDARHPSRRERVWRKMQGHGIKAQSQKKFAVTTDSKHKFPVAPNLLKRKLTTGAPDKGLDWRYHLH